MSQLAVPLPDRLDQAAAAIERAAGAVREALARDAGVPAAFTEAAAVETRREAWRLLLAGEEAPSPDGEAERLAPIRRAALRAAAEALRRHGVPRAVRGAATPIPDGLSADALRGALKEVIPGRRSPAALHLRGFAVEEMASIYGIDRQEAIDRHRLALETLRASLHRRAERMDQPRWSEAFESQPIAATFGMLREQAGPVGSRLHCVAAADLAEALNGTHFRGGRENAIDHACLCDACGTELRVLVALRHQGLAGIDLSPTPEQREELRRAARARPDLRRIVAAAPSVPRRRRWWPWVVLAAAGAAWLLLSR